MFSLLSVFARSFILSLLAVGHAWAAQEVPLDPSCKEVDEAFLRTESLRDYALQISLVRKDGSRKPYIEYVVTEASIRERYAFSDKWKTTPRQPPAPIVGSLPTFTKCEPLGVEESSGERRNRYRATWNDFPYRASADIWTSVDDGLVRLVRRTYLGTNWRFPEATVEDIFSYDADAVATSGKSCAPIVAMIGRQSIVPRAYMTLEFRDGRKGELVLVGWKQYGRDHNSAWSIGPRHRPTVNEFETVKDCEFLGQQKQTSGRLVESYRYVRHLYHDDYEIEVLIDHESGLPIESHWKEITPNAPENEYTVKYSYGAHIKEPISRSRSSKPLIRLPAPSPRKQGEGRRMRRHCHLAPLAGRGLG